MSSTWNPRSAVVAVALMGLTACGGANAAGDGGGSASAPAYAASPAAAPAGSPISLPAASPVTPVSPSESGTPTPTEPPAFAAKIEKVSRDEVRHSWRPGCPVSLSGLRKITMTYWGFDDQAHTGEMVVNQGVARDVVSVFNRLYDYRFPIRRMELVDAYNGSDYDSIDADNTSAFNCRNATGSGSWSQHAYGLAVDINPLENPYVDADGSNAHRNADAYVDRPLKKPGVVNADDRVVRAFEDIGWGWGGYWSGAKDYQHFSSNGR